jgi:hypothetical protein
MARLLEEHRLKLTAMPCSRPSSKGMQHLDGMRPAVPLILPVIHRL